MSNKSSHITFRNFQFHNINFSVCPFPQILLENFHSIMLKMFCFTFAFRECLVKAKCIVSRSIHRFEIHQENEIFSSHWQRNVIRFLQKRTTMQTTICEKCKSNRILHYNFCLNLCGFRLWIFRSFCIRKKHVKKRREKGWLVPCLKIFIEQRNWLFLRACKINLKYILVTKPLRDVKVFFLFLYCLMENGEDK